MVLAMEIQITVRVLLTDSSKILLVNKFFYLNGGSERVFFQEREFLIRHGKNVIDFSMEDYRNFFSRYSKHFFHTLIILVQRASGIRLKLV